MGGLAVLGAQLSGLARRDLVEHVRPYVRGFWRGSEGRRTAARAATPSPTRTRTIHQRLETAAVGAAAALDAAARTDRAGTVGARTRTRRGSHARMALETAVHRVDARAGAGSANPVEREVAVDGVNERLDVHLRLDVREFRHATLGGRSASSARTTPPRGSSRSTGAGMRVRQRARGRRGARRARPPTCSCSHGIASMRDDLQVHR